MIILVVFCLIVMSEIIELYKTRYFKDKLSREFLIHNTLVFIGVFFVIVVLSDLFHLQFKYKLYLLVIAFVSTLLIITYNLKNIQEHYEFENVSQYILRLCVYFRAHQKIYPSLIDAMDGFDDKFKSKCQKLLGAYEAGEPFSDIVLTLSNHYLMKSLAKILESSENVGHIHSEAQLVRLEYDVENWIYQTKTYQKEEIKLRNKMLLLFGVGLLISYFAQNMLMQSVDMQGLYTYQILIFSFLALNICAALYLSKRLTYPWVLRQEIL